MPFTSNGTNRKVNELFKPVKKNGLNATNKTSSAGTDQFIAPKRRRRWQPEEEDELAKLFDKISDDPIYENDIPSFSNDSNMECDSSPAEHGLDNKTSEASADQQLEWLYSGASSGGDAHSDTATPTADDLASMADGFLEEELTEQLKQALSSTELYDDGVIGYRFFSDYCKLPNPSLQDQDMMIMADAPTRKKYDHIVKYSQPEDKRHFFLVSGQLPLWHRLGWQCPRSVFQWLIEIVAFDKNMETARFAMTTVFSLWFDVLRKNSPLYPLTTDGIDYDQKMPVDLFSYIMVSYGALQLPTTDDMGTTTAHQQKDGDDVMMTTSDDRIPLTQFGWVLDLLKHSLTLWPDAYTLSHLHYLANTLVCLGMDGVGVLVLKHVQDALEACLRAFPGDDLDWQSQVQQLAWSLCQQQFVSVGLQVQLPTTAKSACERCLYLRRAMAFMALELAREKDQQESTNAATTHPPMASSQVTLESLSPFLASDGDGILPRLAAMVDDSGGIFQQAEPCYRDYADRICLLDYAIGNDYTDFMASIDAIHSLVTQLQASSRKIGGRLGTLERTKANEVTQRLWSRLAYVIGRNGNTVEDVEF